MSEYGVRPVEVIVREKIKRIRRALRQGEQAMLELGWTQADVTVMKALEEISDRYEWTEMAREHLNIDRIKEKERADQLQARVSLLEEFWIAYEDVENGIVDFDLHAGQVDRLQRAREALYEMGAP